MSHIETATRDIARRLLAVTANNQKSSSNCPEFAIDGIQTPESRSITEARSRLEEAERKKRESRFHAAQNPDASKSGVDVMTNEGTKLLELMRPGGYNFPKMFVTEDSNQVLMSDPNGCESSDYEALLEKISDQAKQIEILEKLQISDAEKLRNLQVESAQYREDVENLFEERELQLSHAFSENISLEKEKKTLQAEISELKGRCDNLAKDNLERQGTLFARLRELEDDLQQTKQELSIKSLRLEALTMDQRTMNHILTDSEGDGSEAEPTKQ